MTPSLDLLHPLEADADPPAPQAGVQVEGTHIAAHRAVLPADLRGARSVYLYAKRSFHLADLWLQAGLEEDNATGTLSVRLLLEGEAWRLTPLRTSRRPLRSIRPSFSSNRRKPML